VSYRDTLGITEEEYGDLLDRLTERTYRGRTYRHLPDYRGDFDRGLVLIDGRVVRGFPKIPRTLVLREGIPRHFGDEVIVEEKLDGYNTRVACVDEPLAFTRGGIVCPFTTHEVRRLLDLESFFADHPDLMLCGEMIGPENPYTAHDYPGVDSVAFRAFDVRRRSTGESLPVPERRELCARYDVPQVPYHGAFSVAEATEAVPEIVRDLDAEGREGIVMKSPDVDRQLKYTTSSANRGDLAYAFSLPFDYGQAFMFRRIIREAFQSTEWGEDEDERRERARDLGEGILLSMIDSVDRVDDGEILGERHTVRSDPAVIDRLLSHLREMGLKIVVEEDRTEDGERVVTFLKRTQSTNDKISAYLDGQIVQE
jgi:putative ATP-dependent DNA ligase